MANQPSLTFDSSGEFLCQSLMILFLNNEDHTVDCILFAGFWSFGDPWIFFFFFFFFLKKIEFKGTINVRESGVLC